MQLIRAINKSNKSNNNNNQKSSESKVVIVAPPPRGSYAGQQHKNDNSGQAGQPPVSPSVALPALKKRTSIVKTAVPPPVPPRGSPRSKSNLIGVSRSHRLVQKRLAPQPTINVDRLMSLSSLEPSGCQKVEKWLETVEVPKYEAAKSIPQHIQFKNVKQIVLSFAGRDDESTNSFPRGHKVFDANVVKSRVESYNSLECGVQKLGKLQHRAIRSSDNGTDSGIDMPARSMSRQIDRRMYLYRNRQFSRDGEFV